jgi:hypothetical protein
MIELFIVLPETWNMMIKTEENQFPSALLLALSKQIMEGRRLDESTFISAEDAELSHLAWPRDIAGFYPVDFSWSGRDEDDESESKEDIVTLLTLLPVKKTKTGVKPADVQKNRQAKWGKFTLKLG